ncbi:MAG: rane protein [Rhodospirillales bacterium]|nr:rane protein [Rhodospirillales bacterium]
MLTLSGIAIVVIGFLVRANPLLVVALAAIVTGLASGLDLVAVISAFGKAFNDDRYVSIPWMVLPVIGVLERYGLQERARQLIGRVRAATPGRLLLVYFAVRQAAAALGLTSLGGHPQMVCPLVAPMAEGAAENRFADLSEADRQSVRAHAAAADNVALFFGEDIFIAIGSILLIKGFLEQNGITVSPLSLSVWAIPTALAALAIHGFRLLLLDRRLRRKAGNAR